MSISERMDAHKKKLERLIEEREKKSEEPTKTSEESKLRRSPNRQPVLFAVGLTIFIVGILGLLILHAC